MKIIQRIMLFAVLLSLLGGCAASKLDNPAAKYKGQSAQQIYDAGIKDLSTKHYNDAIERFEAIDASHPFSDLATKAQLYIIYAYYQSDKDPEALVSCDRFIQLHPDHTGVDYAYFMKGVLNFEQNFGLYERYFSTKLAQRDMQAARASFVTFQELVHAYPKSRYVPSAIKYMSYLRNLMAAHEQAVAAFYFKRKAYVAAISRAGEVVMHYQGAPCVADALSTLVQSYRALHMDDIANQYLAIMQLNNVEKPATVKRNKRTPQASLYPGVMV